MGVLQRFERRLGGIVEGAFARAFKNEVEPVEIAKAMAREADDRAIIGSSRTMAPNAYVIELAEPDYLRLSPYEGPLAAELCDMVREHAQEQGYTLTGTVSVQLERHPDLELGIFRVRSTVNSDVPAPAVVASTVRSATLRTGDRVIALDKPVMSLGRGIEAAIQLPDTGVSRAHAEVRAQDGGYWLVDLGSTNGTYLDGERISSIRLHEGATIKVGTTTLTFHA